MSSKDLRGNNSAILAALEESGSEPIDNGTTKMVTRKRKIENYSERPATDNEDEGKY